MRELLAWYDRHRRDLPWRRTRDPYRIWVSEVMLQQTRVEVVLPYYERFVLRFPELSELARAEIDQVLSLWSGLGYYSRARRLHAAARQIEERGGGFPATVAELRALPGIGEYTAAAVASIAFGAAVPVLDGNVSRVIARLLGQTETRGARSRRLLLGRAGELLDPERPGDSNQALMELGATVCLVRRPLCSVCPLAARCLAAQEGAPERYPAPRAKRAAERRRLVVAVAERAGRALLFRRPEDALLLGGTWELPWVEERRGAAHPSEHERALGAKYGGAWRLGPAAARLRHGITYRDLEVAVHRAAVEERGRAEEAPAPPGGAWELGAAVELGEIEMTAAGMGRAGEVREASGLGLDAAPGEGWRMAAGWFDARARGELPLSSLVAKALAGLEGAGGRG